MVSSDGAAPAFTYGTTGVFQGAARFFVTLGNLDSASNVNPDGTITLILPKSVFPGIQPGQTVNIALGSVRATVPSNIPGTGGTNETIPDTTQPGTYTLRPTNLCLPNTAPVASLTGTPQSGLAPLTVNFNAGSSHDADAIDTIATYTFNFGEGNDDVVQSSPTISHTFNDAGLYDVKLVVTDSRGRISDNTAHLLIDVQRPLGTGVVVSRRAHGTLGNFDIDLPLTGNAGVECRLPGPNNTYNLIYTFNKNVTVPGTATKTPETTAIVGVPTLGPNPNQVTVPLRSVTNKQHVTINLSGVQSPGEVANNQMARMDVVAGDVTANRSVTTGDVTAVQGKVGATVNQSTCRYDVNANGLVTTGDVTTVQGQVGNQLP
jgi:PKD repeat protein